MGQKKNMLISQREKREDRVITKKAILHISHGGKMCSGGACPPNGLKRDEGSAKEVHWSLIVRSES